MGEPYLDPGRADILAPVKCAGRVVFPTARVGPGGGEPVIEASSGIA
jgi:hypothetical protein